MTTSERGRCEADIRAYMQSLDHTALRRIRDADQWVCMLYRTQHGACCLVGHGEGLAEMTDEQYGEWPTPVGLAARASASYEALCECEPNGADRTIAACRHYASHLLNERLAGLVGTGREGDVPCR
jgi:hypothetical protein